VLTISREVDECKPLVHVLNVAALSWSKPATSVRASSSAAAAAAAASAAALPASTKAGATTDTSTDEDAAAPAPDLFPACSGAAAVVWRGGVLVVGGHLKAGTYTRSQFRSTSAYFAPFRSTQAHFVPHMTQIYPWM